MKKVFTPILLFSLLISLSSQAIKAPRTINIPTGPFPNMKAVIDSLNQYGVEPTGPGNIVVNFPATWYEIAPPGGYVLGNATFNSTYTLANGVVFNGGGNTQFIANTGSGAHDAIFTFNGVDNITLDKLRFRDTSTNTTVTSMMEHGVSFVKLISNDGCKNDIVRNCNITLNNTNTTAAAGVSHYGAAGVFIGNCNSSSTVALAPPTIGTTDGAHEGLIIDGDSIQNVNHGVWAYGTGVVIDGTNVNDLNIYIWNNVISNFTHNGVFMAFFNNDQVRGNRMSNMWMNGSATLFSINGIVYTSSIVTATNNSWTCEKNFIELTTGGTGQIAATGIASQIFGTGSTTISEDTVKLGAAGTEAQMVGIWQRNKNGTSLIDKNVISDFGIISTGNTTLNIFGIYNGQTSSATGNLPAYPTSSTITNNRIERFNIISAGALAGCLDMNVVSAVPAIFKNNLISDIANIGSATSAFVKGYQYRGTFNPVAPATLNLTCTGNRLFNLNTQFNATPVIGIDPGTTGTSAQLIADLSSNRFENLTAGSGSITAMLLDNMKSVIMNNDTFLNLTGKGDITAVRSGFTGPGVVSISLTNNLIDSLASSGTNSVVAGISTTTGTSNPLTTFNFANSVIRRIGSTGTNGLAHGLINAGANSTYNIVNNFISDVLAGSNTAAYSSSFGLNLATSGTTNVIFNTINLNSNAVVGGFGATGLLFNPSATNTIQNNIVRVNVTAGGANNVSAIRANNGSAKAPPTTSAFAAASNIYFSPIGSNNYLYVMGTTNSSLVNGYHQSGLSQDATKNIVNDTFFNTKCDISSYHKFMQTGAPTREKKTSTEDNLTGAAGIFTPTGITYAEAAALDGPVGVDFILSARPVAASDIGALEFNGTLIPLMDIKITSSTGFDTACTFNLPTLKATIPSYFNRVSYKWYRDTTKLITSDTATTILVSPVTADYTVRVYDSVTGCTDTSSKFRMTIVPPPPAMITYYDSLTFCESSAIVVQANKGYGYTYRWFRNSTLLAAETDDHLVIDKSGDYNLEVNTILGCPTTSTSIRVKVYPLPTPTVTYAGPRLLETQKYYTYQWYKNNVKINDSDALGKKYYIMSDGAYSVEVTDSNGCTSKSDVFLYSLGINDNQISANIKIYPNPASDKLHIESPVLLNASLTDLSGRVIVSQTDVKDIDVAALANGMYLLNLTDSEGKLIHVEKINKVK
ncbi:MAG: T9SS type A sorting domain-containing protein [Chitinophagaceae bacterium]